MESLAVDDAEYVRLFDKTEAMIACIYASIAPPRTFAGVWAPLGSFVWRRPQGLAELRTSIQDERQAWPPLAVGLFDGKLERATEVVGAVEEFIGRVRDQRGIF